MGSPSPLMVDPVHGLVKGRYGAGEEVASGGHGPKVVFGRAQKAMARNQYNRS